MANPLPPVPYKSQVLNPIGYLNNAWAAWFREAFNRIGGSVALTLPDLEEKAAKLEQQINELTAELNAITGDGDVTELNQGPVL